MSDKNASKPDVPQDLEGQAYEYIATGKLPEKNKEEVKALAEDILTGAHYSEKNRKEK